MKSAIIKETTIVLSFLILFSCDKAENLDTCDKNVIISGTEYKNAPDDPLTIQNVEIVGDCLKIKFSASGCSGDNWVVKLIDSEKIYYSFPPQRKLRLSLKNEELCKAIIGKEYTFSLRELQLPDNQLYLNIEDFDGLILYEY